MITPLRIKKAAKTFTEARRAAIRREGFLFAGIKGCDFEETSMVM